MNTQQYLGRRPWRVPIGLLALGAALVWPAAGIADPSCSVRPSNPTVNAGDSVRWSASVSDISSYRRSYRWEFGGGSPSSSESASPTVRYNQAGTFETKLKVSDRRREAECKTTITVRSGDTQQPSVSIGASPAGPTYTSAQNVSITASASDENGVTRVEFYDNGNLRGTDSSAPYAYQWAVDASANGAHAWTARAYDPSGNAGTSNTLNLTVNIGGGGGPGPAPDVSINSTAQDSRGRPVG